MKLKQLLAFIAALLAIVLLAGCGGNANGNSNASGGTFDDDSKVTCFTEMDSTQKNQLQEYMRSNGDSVASSSLNDDGTQDVCVLEKGPDGSYNEHYYKKDDHFNDYLMYSMLMGHSNTLLTYGLLSGDLSVGDAMALQLLTGVNSSGMMYRPYTSAGGQWVRTPNLIDNSVTNVYYGTNPAPTRYSSSLTPPSGYATKPLPPVADAVGSASKSGVTATSQTGAKDAAKKSNITLGKAPVPTTMAKNASSPYSSYSKPQANSGSGSGSNSKSQPNSGSTSNNKPAAPAAPKPAAPAPKPAAPAPKSGK